MTLLNLALVVCAASFLLAIIRAAIGPTLADRTVSADLCLFILVATLAILAVRAPATAFVDVVLVATLLGFVATIAFAKLVLRRRM